MGLSSLSLSAVTDERDDATQVIREFGEEHYPAKKFYYLPNVINQSGKRWEAFARTGNAAIAIVAIKINQSFSKQHLSLSCTSSLTRPFRMKLTKEFIRQMSAGVDISDLYDLSSGAFQLSNLKRKPIQHIGAFSITGCEANVENVNSEMSRLKLRYRLSKLLYAKDEFDQAVEVAEKLLQNKKFADSAAALIISAALSLNKEDAIIHAKKNVNIGSVNDPEILFIFAKATANKGLIHISNNAINRCLELHSSHKGCLNFFVENKADETENPNEIYDLMNYFPKNRQQ